MILCKLVLIIGANLSAELAVSIFKAVNSSETLVPLFKPIILHSHKNRVFLIAGFKSYYSTTMHVFRLNRSFVHKLVN